MAISSINGWKDLPNELMLTEFTYLDSKSIVITGRVCKNWCIGDKTILEIRNAARKLLERLPITMMAGSPPPPRRLSFLIERSIGGDQAVRLALSVYKKTLDQAEANLLSHQDFGRLCCDTIFKEHASDLTRSIHSQNRLSALIPDMAILTQRPFFPPDLVIELAPVAPALQIELVEEQPPAAVAAPSKPCCCLIC